MKSKTKFFTLISFLAIASLIIVNSCEKNITTEKGCNVADPEKANVNLSLESKSISFTCDWWDAQSIEGYEYKLGSTTLDGQSYESICNYIQSFISIDEPYLVVLYFNKDFTESNIESQNIIGYSIYTVIDRKLFHQIYVKSIEGYTHLKDWDIFVGGVIIDQLAFNMTQLMNCSGTKSNLTLWNASKPFINIKEIRETISTKMSEYLSLREQTWNCGSPCDILENAWCYNDPVAGPYCRHKYDNGTCVQTNTAGNVSDSTSISQTIIDDAFDNDLHYEFRDDFMFSYDIGQKYVNYYYAISDELDNELPLSLGIDLTYFLYDNNDRFSILLDPTSYSETILIDLQLKNDLIDLLEEFGELSEDEDYQDIIEDIVDDINTYYDMTVEDIIDDISN